MWRLKKDLAQPQIQPGTLLPADTPADPKARRPGCPVIRRNVPLVFPRNMTKPQIRAGQTWGLGSGGTVSPGR